MSQFFRVRRKRVGQAPGTVEYVGKPREDPVAIAVMDYGPDHLEETAPARIAACLPYRDTESVTWIDIRGLHDVDLLREIGEHYGLHALVLEDIVNTSQRPKLEDYGDYLFVVCRMLQLDEASGDIESEQVSLVLGPGWVLSFQERTGDVFEPVRERVRHGKGRIRKGGPDYLAYALLDAVVDHYFVVAEQFGDEIESLEEELLGDPQTDLLETIHRFKREIIVVRRSVWPLREVVAAMTRDEIPLIQEATRTFLRDVHDHVIQVADIIESFRDILSGLQDLYLSSLSHRMNEVMKVLTIAATIFVPLTFIAGIYGMNFENMPELGWRWGYPAFWVVTVVVGGGMVLYFRRKRWL